MGRLIVICLVAGGFSLDNCGDDPVGPQPDKPIKPPEGYTGQPPPEPGAPATPTPAAAGGGGGAAAPTPAPAPAADQPKCPKDAASLVTAKAHPAPKDKKKRVELKLTAKSGGAQVTFKRVIKTEDGTADDVKAEGAELTALVDPAKAKARVLVLIQCGWEDRTLAVTVDAKTAQVKEIPPPPEPGFLNVIAEPGLKVSTGGKDLGVTPLRNVQLPPGKYTLKLEPKKGKTRTASVEIKPGETTTHNEKPEPKKK